MDVNIPAMKRQSASLLSTLKEIKGYGLTSPKAQQIFYDNRNHILALIGEEERSFHPVLKRMVEEDYYQAKTVHFFISEVDAASKKVTEFFDRHKEPEHGLAYAEEFGAVYAALLQRSRLEDHALYNIYIEIMDARAAKKAVSA